MTQIIKEKLEEKKDKLLETYCHSFLSCSKSRFSL